MRERASLYIHSMSRSTNPSVTLALVVAVCLFLAGTTARAGPVDTCRVGIFVISLYDLDFPNDSFTADFWLWFLYPNDSLNALGTVEIAGAKKYEFQHQDVDEKLGLNWATMKCKGVIRQDWDVSDFPFDRQVLKIVFESADADTSELVYVADTKNSAIDSSIRIDGWDLEGFALNGGTRTYATTYGDPTLKSSSSYATVVATIDIQRNGLRLFLKSFTGVYVAFLIAILGFFIDPVEVDPRFGLPVGALFATVGNKYIVDGILPDTTTFTLVDTIHTITFFYILATVIGSVISLALAKRGRSEQSRRFDRWAFAFCCFTYTVYNVVIVVGAAT